MHSETLPKIVKAIFIVDKDRRYSFDVNQTIKIHYLKKIIIAAANLGHNLRLFHEGQEYTDYESETLLELFPSLDVIIFDLELSYENIEELDDIIKLKLTDKYCPLHFSKYPYFYCHTCKKSICSECYKSGAHKNHDVKEKYDYLQSSQNLVKNIFGNVGDMGVGQEDEYYLKLKEKIKFKYFDSLIKMLKEIEGNLALLVEEFVKKNKKNIEKIKKNMIQVRNYVAEGFDDLKDKISIEDMMLDEEIYLTFDSKYKDVIKNKNKILGDIETYNQFKQKLKILEDNIESIYNEIYSFLEKYRDKEVYNEISNKVNEKGVLPVSKKYLDNIMLSDVKKKEKLFRKRKRSDEEL
jgi:hypothetical protein